MEGMGAAGGRSRRNSTNFMDLLCARPEEVTGKPNVIPVFSE